MHFLLLGVPSAEGDPYHTLVSAVVLPKLQSAISTQWVARDPELLLKWMDEWESVLPPDVHRRILETLVFPKVTACLPRVPQARCLCSGVRFSSFGPSTQPFRFITPLL